MTKSKIRHPPSSPGKRIAAPASIPVAYDREPPAFCLKFLSGEYCITKCTAAEKAAFADTLFQLSRRTWLELKLTAKHGAGCEKIERSSLKSAVPASVPGDTVFLAFRFFGKAPMVGFRQGRTFHIVWFDREFTLYDHT